MTMLETRISGSMLDHSADLGSWHERQVGLDLVLAGDHERIEIIDGGGADGNAHHPLGGRACIDVFEAHRLGSAELAHDPGFHPGKATSGEKVGDSSQAPPSAMPVRFPRSSGGARAKLAMR